MYPGTHAAERPDKPAFIMASSGEVVTYRQLNERSNQVSQLFRSLGLQRGDGIAMFMENNRRYLEIAWAAHRAGLYYTPISSQLTAPEVEYIVNDCGARLLISSRAKAEVAQDLTTGLPAVQTRLMVGDPIEGFESFDEAVEPYPVAPIEDESEGADMLYSSGTTGRPKGVKHELPEEPIGTPLPALLLLGVLYGITQDSVYLSPAPLYHAAPLRYNMWMLRFGATCVIMERFDAEGALALIERYHATHSQWVPTMFIRMLKLPEEVRARYDVSSLQAAIHAAAPCPIPIKEQMIDWWGPVLHEYYAGTEGNGYVGLSSEEWLEHKGSVGKPVRGVVHILGPDGEELPPREIGTIYFEEGGEFEYHNDPEKTRASYNDKGWSTLSDMGYVDEDGFLYLSDRKQDMIISGGVNIYPQEAENLLATHPEVLDVAVFGVPNEEFGEEVKAVVQLSDPSKAGPELEEELIAFCREQLAGLKCPRSVDFEKELPRHPNGKLYKRLLRDRYWKDHQSRII